MKYNTATLDNGLRVIHLLSASHIVYCGFHIAAGTRHEAAYEEGLAHLCEHMAFKGTASKSALQIVNRLEGVGGELNAFTTKECTTYYAALLSEHIERATELLCDLVFRSECPSDELRKEVEVVCDEIESYNDSPSERIYDEFEGLLFEGHPLGHSILGSLQKVRSYGQTDVLRFYKRYYRPSNMVFFASGDVAFDKLCRLLSRYTPTGNEAQGEAFPATGAKLQPYHPRYVARQIGSHQAHVMMGCRAYSGHHPLRTALYILNNMLGGPAMNARLNLSLRERHGLVYTVESIMTTYGDTGTWCVYFGCDHKDVKKCISLIQKELQRFMEKPLSERRLAAAKRQIKGQIGVACDNREQFSIDFGRGFLFYDDLKSLKQMYRRIDSVTSEQIQQVAGELFGESNLSTLILR